MRSRRNDRHAERREDMDWNQQIAREAYRRPAMMDEDEDMISSNRAESELTMEDDVTEATSKPFFAGESRFRSSSQQGFSVPLAAEIPTIPSNESIITQDANLQVDDQDIEMQDFTAKATAISNEKQATIPELQSLNEDERIAIEVLQGLSKLTTRTTIGTSSNQPATTSTSGATQGSNKQRIYRSIDGRRKDGKPDLRFKAHRVHSTAAPRPLHQTPTLSELSRDTRTLTNDDLAEQHHREDDLPLLDPSFYSTEDVEDLKILHGGDDEGIPLSIDPTGSEDKVLARTSASTKKDQIVHRVGSSRGSLAKIDKKKKQPKSRHVLDPTFEGISKTRDNSLGAAQNSYAPGVQDSMSFSTPRSRTRAYQQRYGGLVQHTDRNEHLSQAGQVHAEPATRPRQSSTIAVGSAVAQRQAYGNAQTMGSTPLPTSAGAGRYYGQRPPNSTPTFTHGPPRSYGSGAYTFQMDPHVALTVPRATIARGVGVYGLPLSNQEMLPGTDIPRLSSYGYPFTPQVTDAGRHGTSNMQTDAHRLYINRDSAARPPQQFETGYSRFTNPYSYSYNNIGLPPGTGTTSNVRNDGAQNQQMTPRPPQGQDQDQ